MQQAMRKIVSRKDLHFLSVPASFGEKVELIISPINNAAGDDNSKSLEMMKQKDNNGFVAQVLADASEDVWNDL